MRNKRFLFSIPRNIRGNIAGFTIIELLIAFTILAAVAGSLFQVFYVSERNNRRAEETDVANNIATTAVELFKADPDISGGYVKYFDPGWNEISELSVPCYILETTLTAELVQEPDGEAYRDAAAEAALDSQESYRLVITDASGDLEVHLNGVPLEVKSEGVGTTLPVKVYFNRVGVLPKRITVINKTEIPAVLNVFNIPQNAANDERALSALLQVTPAEGSCGVSYYSENRQQNERYIYHMEAVVKKLEAAGTGTGTGSGAGTGNDTGNGTGAVELARYGTGKYVVK